MTTEVKDVDARTLSTWMTEGDVVLVDVRPAERFAEEHIGAAVSMPLATLQRGALPDVTGKRLVFQCQVGVASRRAGRRVIEQGFGGEVHHLAGGIAAWKRAGLAVEGPGAGRLSLQRQVQIVSGALVLLGLALGATVSPWLYGIAAFVGAGSVFAGASGTCGMAAVLGWLPFNRDASA